MHLCPTAVVISKDSMSLPSTLTQQLECKCSYIFKNDNKSWRNTVQLETPPERFPVNAIKSLFKISKIDGQLMSKFKTHCSTIFLKAKFCQLHERPSQNPAFLPSIVGQELSAVVAGEPNERLFQYRKESYTPPVRALKCISFEGILTIHTSSPAFRDLATLLTEVEKSCQFRRNCTSTEFQDFCRNFM